MFEGVGMGPLICLPFHGSFWLCVVTLLLLPTVAGAEFFKYKDDGGNLIITNRMEDVPKKYRSRVKVVWDKDLEAKDPLARRNAEAEKLREERALQQSKQEQPARIERKKTGDGKMLVITIDEETGQLIRTFE
jgi:hypothetical protein